MTNGYSMNLKSFACGGLPTLFVLGMWAVAAAGDPSQIITRTYTSPEGDVYSSISVKAPQAQPVKGSIDHVVLVDTSASQVGEHRTRAFDVLASFLESLPAHDRAAVIAMDVQTASVTDGMAAPAVAAEQALARLQKRFPAGSSDVQQGLLEAAARLASSERGSILYIGDGMSAAHLLQVEEVQALVKTLRSRRIPVHAYGVGSNMDMHLLGVLGAETGGFVMRDEWSEQALSGAEAGSLLAAAARRPVLYPEAAQLSSDGGELLPNRPLPVRTDRETVYLIRGELAADAALVLSHAGGKIRYEIGPTNRTSGNTFLSALWRQGSQSDGLTNGLAGDWMVTLAQQSFEDTVAAMEAQGVHALRSGDFKAAETIGFNLQKVDPNNARALSLIQHAGERQFVAAQAEPQLGEPAEPPVAEPPAEAPRPGTLTEQVIEDITARGQKLRRMVELDIERANAVLETRPDAAAEILEQAAGAVKAETRIDADLKNQLLRRVNAAILDLQSRRRQIESRIQQQQLRLAEEEAQQRLLDYAAERDRELEQYADRARALMVDGYHGNPAAFAEAEEVARQAISEFPNSAIATSMVFVSEAAQQLDRSERLRLLRSDKFLETLHYVETSHVPFPDEPPIVYPSPQRWQEITEMRKKWESVDLRRNSPNEERIYQELDSLTSIEFPGNPLSDVINFIEQFHGIPIRMNTSALADAGVAEDTEVNLVISGISLRSALKLLLEDVGGVPLTYIIEDEVMKITTLEEADASLQTRVYPVADLVIPVMPLMGGYGGMMAGGGGMMGGGMGGMGGGMGGMGGGMGGMGGGMMGGMGGMGGGMGGMGGGFFSVPSAAIPTDLSKKKPLP